MAQGHNKNINESSNRRKNKLRIVTVLSIRDGGSLGAYGCGVYKTLSKYGVNFNIVSDSSIGSNDASIVAGTRTENPVQTRSNAFTSMPETALIGSVLNYAWFFP